MSIDEPGGLPSGYSLVWSDEFETPGLPSSQRWNYDTFANPTGWFNRELQYYAKAREKNSRVEGGRLVVEAHAESAAIFPDARVGNPQAYTSARLITQGKASWTYGYLEARAQVPCTQGAWPAIWMLGDVPNLQWPLDGEIDLMEHINNEAQVHFSVHTQAYNHAQGTAATRSRATQVCDGSFHDYQMLWTRDWIKLGIDGRFYLQYNNMGKGKSQWPFDGPQFLLVNLAVGGDWPGSPNASSTFPIRMQVEHIRVYQAR
jgi:beta-glucanase (GH16 family)